MRRWTATLVLVVGCHEGPTEVTDFAELCGADAPVRLLELYDDENVFLPLVIGDDVAVPILRPTGPAMTWIVDRCGRDEVVPFVASGTTTRADAATNPAHQTWLSVPFAWRDVVVACDLASNLVWLDEPRSTTSQTLVEGDCAFRSAGDALILQRPHPDDSTLADVVELTREDATIAVRVLLRDTTYVPRRFVALSGRMVHAQMPDGTTHGFDLDAREEHVLLEAGTLTSYSDHDLLYRAPESDALIWRRREDGDERVLLDSTAAGPVLADDRFVWFRSARAGVASRWFDRSDGHEIIPPETTHILGTADDGELWLTQSIVEGSRTRMWFLRWREGEERRLVGKCDNCMPITGRDGPVLVVAVAIPDPRNAELLAIDGQGARRIAARVNPNQFWIADGVYTASDDGTLVGYGDDPDLPQTIATEIEPSSLRVDDASGDVYYERVAEDDHALYRARLAWD